MFTGSFRLMQSSRQVEKLVLQEARDYISSQWAKRLPTFSVELRRLLKEALENQPEYQALTSTDGILKAEFGLGNDAKTRVDSVVTHWLDSLQVDYKQLRVSNNGLRGGIVFRAIRSNMLDVLALPESSYVSESSGETVPFMRWLMLSGDRVVVRNYRYEPNVGLGNSVSRSGNGLMIRKKGGFYRVSPIYAGDQKRNWTTAACDSLLPELARLVEATFTL